jgi:N6-L-threonylcarbamoyladenine synthase
MENKLARLEGSPGDIAYCALATIADAVGRATLEALKRLGPLNVLHTGGVAASRILRGTLDGYFASPEYSADNAAGVAILTYRELL